jgi:hypothetical protein
MLEQTSESTEIDCLLETIPAFQAPSCERSYMPDKRDQPSQSLPVANYSPAIARAIEWLGDRYLLAKPINAASSRESPAFAHSRPRSTNR